MMSEPEDTCRLKIDMAGTHPRDVYGLIDEGKADIRHFHGCASRILDISDCREDPAVRRGLFLRTRERH